MGKMTKEDFNILQPVPTMIGGYQVYSDRVEATFKCKDCGNTILLTLRGQTKSLSSDVIHELVRRQAVKKHVCKAIISLLTNKKRLFFSDLLRGSEMLQEAEYKDKKLGRA